jgi:hypothetical protein
MEENARSRSFIERLLRHQAFTPFLEELSRDESLQPKPMTSMPSSSTPVVSTPAPAQFQPQSFNDMPQPENTHVGMTMIPEPQLDFSMLNINTGNAQNWGSNNGFSFQQPRVFAVTELPEGPVNPLDTEAMSGKGHSAIFQAEEDTSAEETKAEYPIVECPIEQSPVVEECEEEDAEYDLYFSSPARSSAALCEPTETLFANPEKAMAHYSLIISDEANEARLAERLERNIARLTPALERIAAITSMLDL